MNSKQGAYGTLADDLFILAIGGDGELAADDEALEQGLAAALMLELIRGGQLHPKSDAGERQGPGSRPLEVIHTRRLADPLLAEALRRILASSEAVFMKDCVSLLATELELIPRVADRLVARGVIAEREVTVLGLLRIRGYRVLDQRRVGELRRKVMATLFGVKPEERDLLLVTLLDRCGLIANVVPEAERRDAEKRAEAISRRMVSATGVPTAADALEGAGLRLLEELLYAVLGGVGSSRGR